MQHINVKMDLTPAQFKKLSKGHVTGIRNPQIGKGIDIKLSRENATKALKALKTNKGFRVKLEHHELEGSGFFDNIKKGARNVFVNVLLGGLQIYPQNVIYNYEMFLNEMNGQYGINANKTTGLCSSRISQIDYNNTYGYLVSDLSRRLPEDDTTAMSVSITGTNAGAKPIDLYIYIEYEKSITIDLLSGKKLD